MRVPGSEGQEPLRRFKCLRKILGGRLAALLIAVAVVTAVMLVGDARGTNETTEPEEPPATLSVEQFCPEFNKLVLAHSEAINQTDPDTIAAMQGAARNARAAAGQTPQMPANARQGVTIVVDLLDEVPIDASREQLVRPEGTPTLAEETYVAAFMDFLDANCDPPPGYSPAP